MKLFRSSFGLIAISIFLLSSSGTYGRPTEPLNIQRDLISSTDQLVFINSKGQVTVFGRPVDLKDPIVLKLPEQAIAVSGSYAVTVGGKLWFWNKSCRWPSESEIVCTYGEPRLVRGLNHVASVDHAMAVTYIIKEDGSLWGAGDNSVNQIPQSLQMEKFRARTIANFLHLTLVPHNFVRIPIPEPIVEVSTNGVHAIALAASGSVWAWGDNFYQLLGEDGRRSTDSIASLYRLSGFQKVRKVKAGNIHNYIILQDGSVAVLGGCPTSDPQFGETSEQRRTLKIDTKVLEIDQNYGGTWDIVYTVSKDNSIHKILVDDQQFYYSGGTACTPFTGSTIAPHIDLPYLPELGRPLHGLAVDSDVGYSFGIVALTDDGSLVSLSPHPPARKWNPVPSQ